MLGPAACGAESFDRDQAIESFLSANEEATEAQGACVVDALVDLYGTDDLQGRLAASPLDADFEETQFREMFRCGVGGAWEDDLTTQLVEAGVDEADAPCVTDELFATMSDDDIDVLLSGEITESFSETFFQALDACDALNP